MSHSQQGNEAVVKSLEKIQGNDLIQGAIKLVITRQYGKTLWFKDFNAAVIVTLMLIPQSLAYALVAGLPPEAGLYASILPLIAYALFGTSAALAVGPVAIVSLLTANTLVPLADIGSPAYVQLALVLALLVGFFYFIMGVLKLGFITQLLSYPVMKGFITASSLLIIVGQIKPLTGISMSRGNLIERLHSMDVSTLHVPSTLFALMALVILFGSRSRYGSLFFNRVLGRHAAILKRLLPMLIILITALISGLFHLAETGMATVGELPQGLPSFTFPTVSWTLIAQLALPAFIITLIGMAESIAVAQTLGAAKRQRISPNRELLGLGAANIAAGFSGGFPVTGGMARSVVNADAGAETPLAGAMTAVLLSLGILFLTPWLAYIPIPVLAATIIVAVSQLLEFPSMMNLVKVNRVDGLISWLTAGLVLFWEVEAGLLVGVAASIIWLLANHRQPYLAEVGRLPQTERFKNIHHANTETLAKALFIRIDESITFINASLLEQTLLTKVAERESLKHVIIVASGIHHIDSTGANMLKRFRHEMELIDVSVYISDVKVPLARELAKFHLFIDDPDDSLPSTIEVYQTLKSQD